MELLSVGEVNH